MGSPRSIRYESIASNIIEIRSTYSDRIMNLTKIGFIFSALAIFVVVGRFAWETPIRFALTPEEAGLLLVRMSQRQPLEVARRSSGADRSSQYSSMTMPTAEKIFRAAPHDDGSMQFTIDYELDGVGSQAPPTSNEAVGNLFSFCFFRYVAMFRRISRLY